jgi:hypothetical protein
MWLLILEAMAALAILAFGVWWTMFSGRKRRDDDEPFRSVPFRPTCAEVIGEPGCPLSSGKSKDRPRP